MNVQGGEIGPMYGRDNRGNFRAPRPRIHGPCNMLTRELTRDSPEPVSTVSGQGDPVGCHQYPSLATGPGLPKGDRGPKSTAPG